MKACKIMLFSVLVLELIGCSAPQTSENTSPLNRSQTSSEPQERLSVVWGVLLNTFDGLGHEMAAQRMAQTCRSMSPILNNTWIHSKRRGSSVLIGRFRSAKDPAARRLLSDVRTIERNGRSVFPRPMLVRIDPRKRPEDFGEMELLRVRGSFPDQTLYTLQVEVWSDFGTSELSAAQVRARAEGACARLRREGWTAYVHHEVDRVISSVTVGLYDNRSIDAESGLDLDPALIRARKRFPHHLVNGEELQEPIDPRRPSLGTRRQAPQLVEVPKI